MAIGITLLDGNSSTLNATTYATASISPAAGGVILVITAMNGISVSTSPNTVSGLSGTWNLFGSFYGTGTATVQFSAHWCANYSGTGALTLGNADAGTNALWSVVLLTGVDTTTPLVAGSFKTVTSASSNGDTLTLNAAANANNRPFGAFCNNNNTAGQAAPTSGSWTELHDLGVSTPSNILQTQWRSDTFDTADSCTYTGGPYASSAIGFEINAASAAVSIISTATVRRRNAPAPSRKWIGQQGRSVTPVRAQVNPPWPTIDIRGLRRSIPPARRGRTAQPIVASQVALSPSWVAPGARARVARRLPTRNRASAALWAPLTAREALPGAMPRRRLAVPSRRLRASRLPPPQALRSLVPGYVYPTLGQWATWCTYPNQPSVLIANPGTGPGTVVNSDYTTWIGNALTAGIQVIGYVNLGYALRTLGTSADTATSNTVFGDINGWVALYPNVLGIFFDLSTTDAANLAYVQSAISYARSKFQGGLVVINPGTYPLVSGYLDAADITCVWEGDYSSEAYPSVTLPPWATYVPNYPPTKMAHIVRNVPDTLRERITIAEILSFNVGWAYITDKLDYTDIPSYWSATERFDLWTQTTATDDGFARRLFVRRSPVKSLPRRGKASTPVALQQAAAANPSITATVFGRLRTVGRIRAAARIVKPIPPQVNPPIPASVFGRMRNAGRVRARAVGVGNPLSTQPIVATPVSRRARNVGRLRSRPVNVVPTQQSTVTNPSITATVFGRLRSIGRVRPPVRASNPTPAQQSTVQNPPITATVFGRLRSIGRVRPPSRVSNPTPAQQSAVINPSITATVFGRLRSIARVRPPVRVSNLTPTQTTVQSPSSRLRNANRVRRPARVSSAAPAQQATVQSPSSRLRNANRVRRPARGSNPTPAQQSTVQNPSITATVFGRLRSIGRVRPPSRVSNPTPAQQAAVINPSITATVFGRLRSIGRVRPPSRVSNPTPAQQSAVTNPSITATVFGRLRNANRMRRPARVSNPTPTQQGAVQSPSNSRLRNANRVRHRAKLSNPTPAQQVPNPTVTQTVFGRLRLVGRTNRIPRVAKPIPVQVNPPYPVKPSRVVAFRGLSRRRGAPVSAPQVQPTAETRTIPALGLRGLRRLWLAIRRKTVTPVPDQVTTLQGPLVITDSHGDVGAGRNAGAGVGGVYGSASAATVKDGATSGVTADPDNDNVIGKYDSDSDSL